MWASDFIQTDDGMLIYCAATKNEYGTAFVTDGDGKICIFYMKKDRFVSLTAEDEGVIATRENIWNSGEAHINLSAEKATFAVYESIGNDYYGTAHPLDGYSHDDCLPFSGYSIDWIPRFKQGRTLDDLKGRTIVLEVKIQKGSIYSITGDCIPIMNLQGARYRKLGRVPTKII